MSRIKGLRKVAVVADSFKLSYTKGYGILELTDKTIIDCSLPRLLGYTNYAKKDDLEKLLSRFMGE
ncbi:hypothetical protein ACVWU4_000996 [Campylobacter coli]